MGVTLRVAREDDLDRLVAIHSSAFPDPRGHDARVRNFAHNPLGPITDLWVLEDEGALVAHGFLFSMRAHFGGIAMSVGGVATVGVAPEARGKGIGTTLLAHLHTVARDRCLPVTLLYPFRQAFYGRLGYAPTSTYRRLRLHPASVPWTVAHRIRPLVNADRARAVQCREAWAATRTGVVGRGEMAWDAAFCDERRTWLVVEAPHGVEGYVSWTLEQGEPHAPIALVVRDMFATTAEAERSLWGALRLQRDQVTEVRVDVALDDPVAPALVDADRLRFGDAQVEHVLGEVVGGPMVRIGQVKSALEARGWPTEGRVTIAMDGQCFAVTASRGRAHCESTQVEPEVTVDARALSAVAFGGLPAGDAARFGWLSARNESALARFAALMASPPYFSPDAF